MEEKPKVSESLVGGDEADLPHARSKNICHWNLRSFHEQDNSIRRRDNAPATNPTAFDVFGGGRGGGGGKGSSWTSSTDVIPTGSISGSLEVKRAIIDGQPVTFELRKNITQRPTTDRETRVRRSLINTNVTRSSWEIRLRLWMMKFSISVLSIVYFGLFILMNVIFAGLFYADENRCCDDPTLTFAEVFDFTIQTSTTIGYGGYVPSGFYANFLVVALSYCSMLTNTVFAGLIFMKFVTPSARIEFSDVMTMSNVNGYPCLQMRVGNADGLDNVLTDVNARFTHVYGITYKDEDGTEHRFGQSQELKLLNSHRDELDGVWTLNHVMDESSPLFGLNLSEYPGNSIITFQLTITTTQDTTKSPISQGTRYMVEDIMIGHCFEDQTSWDADTRVATVDYSKMSATVPAPVWYPAPKTK